MHYTGTIWRSPYEASSLLLEVTAGCTHHKCKFCTLYHDLLFPFRMSPLQGALPEDKAALVLMVDRIMETAGEEELREYHKNLPHL